MKPSPRQKLGHTRTEAACKAVGMCVGGLRAHDLILDTDPLGRGADTLTISSVSDDKVLGKLLHCPGMYGEDSGDWHIKFDSRISWKADDCKNPEAKWPLTAWMHDSGPHRTPETALAQFSRKVAEGMKLCPEAFV